MTSKESLDVLARLVGGPHDGTTRRVTTDQFGYLGAYPVTLGPAPKTGPPDSGGIYWPTWERDGDILIYRWREGPEPNTPPWLKTFPPTWPRIARDRSGGIHYVDTPTK